MIAKKQNRKQFSPETWATIRVLYETGKFASALALQAHCSKILPLAPSFSSIEKRIAKEGWSKGGIEDAITEEKRKSATELFAELGMDERKRIKLIVDGIHAGEDAIPSIINAIISSGGDVTKPEVTNVIRSMMIDLGVRYRYLDMANKITGEYAPEKKKVTVRGALEQQPTETKFAEMSDEELTEKMARLLERQKI